MLSMQARAVFVIGRLGYWSETSQLSYEKVICCSHKHKCKKFFYVFDF